MHSSIFIAAKFFINKSSKSLLHRMNLIACFSISISTMALIVVLSIFNGLEGAIKDLFLSFDPDLKIDLKQGKYFQLDHTYRQSIQNIKGVNKIVEVIEDNVLLAYRGQKLVATLKGVSENFIDQSPLAPFIIQGNFSLKNDNQHSAIIGLGIQNILAIQLNDAFQDLQVYYPQQIKTLNSFTKPLYTKQFIRPGAVFAVEKHFDDQYIIVPLDFASNLMGIGAQRTALEVYIEPGYSIASIKKSFQACLPENLQVRDNKEQHATLIRAMRIERLFVLITLCFILLVASLNIFFMLSMFVLDKSKDIYILYGIGMSKPNIQRIFLFQGLFISLTGAILGMVIAWILTTLQQRFEILTLGMQTGPIKAYPIERQLKDFIFTTVAVVCITFVAAFSPAQLATKMLDKVKYKKNWL